ncbi:hypothetical protein CkaCkLH20_05184 [Colletotrichum karsti]|uniref:Uncharacterized protein n=1 Tax=Colletotrichum karsti TaxID=1095194 RepID=A0A9P6LIN2_9PEZI|nr:uncharacterized protein CkaCkLH20_05184 [Colletotrichum karsti]KAF9877484.1 hypothetical protein CkaCkLH20_05184 [Colletotrichum karsti]
MHTRIAYRDAPVPCPPRRSCLKSGSSAGRKFWGSEAGGRYYVDSEAAGRGVSRTAYLQDQRASQVYEYERRVAAEDRSWRSMSFPSARRYSRSYSYNPNVVGFAGHTVYVYSPEESLREISRAGYKLVSTSSPSHYLAEYEKPSCCGHHYTYRRPRFSSYY